ncbi:hypothetical protein FB451DRAFT_1527895 [Mycena latifolia]|nr:hypothetical protein FB451DRAFT_1527895 [Mycena latifolia]
MSATTVLRVQELCDQISSYLPESKWDLTSCALVSPTFTSSAQRHLFHDIIFNRGCLDIDDPSLLDRYDEVGPCKRFCAVMKNSPHLLPLVRRLRVTLEPAALSPLCELMFPNLEVVVFHRRRSGAATEEKINLGAQLISAPTIRRIGMVSLIFSTMYDLNRLFQRCPPAMDSVSLQQCSISETASTLRDGQSIPSRRFRIKTLRFRPNYGADGSCLLDPFSPFDFSKLATLDYGSLVLPPVQVIFQQARMSLRKLTVDCSYVESNTAPAFLAQFPVLTDLRITSPAESLDDAITLLAGLPTPNQLARLAIEIKNVRVLKADGMQRLAAACANADAGCSVVVHVRHVASGAQGVDNGTLVRSAFAELDVRGLLQVVVR